MNRSAIVKFDPFADTWGMTISPHLFPELMVQVMASIPNGHMLEYLDFLDDLWVGPVLPKNGMRGPSQKPGHGLSFKEEALREGRILR
jgi:D-arabinonate dehydratase